jgi:hypothetical protein
MSSLKKITVLAALLFLSVFSSVNSKAQGFYLGFESNAVYSWFNSPDIEDLVASDGWGWNLGFFMRYGKRPFIQLGLNWTRSVNDFSVVYYNEEILDEDIYTEDIKLNNFDFSVKAGYELLHTPMFRIDVHGGPFIGRSLMFSGESILFDNDSFKRPQLGINGGLGFQFTNFIFGLDYNYHFTELFNPIDINGQSYNLGAKLQMIQLKLGLMF